MSEEGKNSFVLYNSYYDKFSALSREERGDLIMSIFEFHQSGEITTELTPICSMAFSFIKDQLAIDAQKYENICERNRKNGKNGGRPKKNPAQNPKNPMGFDADNADVTRASADSAGNVTKTQKPKKPDNDNDNDNDNDYDNDYDSSSISPSPRGISVDGECENRFNRFWEAYPKKYDRNGAFAEWRKISPDEELTRTIIEAVRRQSGWLDWCKENGRFIPKPENWLKDRRWSDRSGDGAGSGSISGATKEAHPPWSGTWL